MSIEMECNQIRTVRQSFCHNRDGLPLQQGLGRVKRLLTPLVRQIIHFLLNEKGKFTEGIFQAKMNIILPQSMVYSRIFFTNKLSVGITLRDSPIGGEVAELSASRENGPVYRPV